MKSKLKWFFHPIFVFVFSIVALSLSLILYIYWYVEASTGLMALVRRYNLDGNQFLEAKTWVVILVISILMSIILAGTIIIFVYGQQMMRLYGLQHDFINNFTHELKTPVTSLKLYLETFLRYDIPRDEQRKYLDYMLQDVDRLSSNISRILNLARIETKTYSGEFIVTELVESIEKFREENAHLFPHGDIHIHKPTDHAYYSQIDPVLFQMLLMNLITNAMTYNESERPAVNIRFVMDRNMVRIHFEDNGIGIKKSDRKKIFRKFYRVNQPRHKTTKGSGLGLYLVQDIARIHKGEVNVASREEGEGSVFTVNIPILKNRNRVEAERP